MKSTLRQSNIELLRIVLMIMILIHHVLFHALGLKDYKLVSLTFDSNLIKLFFESFTIIAVNVFVFISGYYGIKFKVKGLLQLAFQVLCYSIFIFILSIFIDKQVFSPASLIKALLPVSSSQYWFISVYLGLYVLSPFLNKGIELFEKKALFILMAILIYFNFFSGFLFGTLSQSGYSIFNFIVIYLLGRVMMKHPIEVENVRRSIFLYVLSFLLILLPLLAAAYVGIPTGLYHWLSYNNPIILVSAVLFFFVFKNLNIPNNKFINLVAGQVLGVYIIHDNPFIRKYFIQSIIYLESYFGDKPMLFVLFLILFIFSLYTICSLIELLRKKITERPFEYLYSALRRFFFKRKFVQKLKLDN